jgi:ribosomal protein S18 acetylase RimI-like enzyme
MHIRPATDADLEAMWDIFQSVIATGDTLPFSSDFDRETFRSHWFGTQTAYVAAIGSRVLGMYKLGANYPGLGSHVASATYLVSPAAQGKGIGRTLVEHSLDQARNEGFMAMQFNYVVSTNAAAVELYKRLGFAIAGTLPSAFRHQTLGLVDAYVMFRFLCPQDPPATRSESA